MSDEMLVADDALLLLNPKPNGNRIPAFTPDGYPIRRVIESAVRLTSPTLDEQFVVEDGIQSIGGYLGARKLVLPYSLREWTSSALTGEAELWRGMREEDWQVVLRNSRPISGGRRILTGSWEVLGIHGKKENDASWVPFDADELFYTLGPRSNALYCLPLNGARAATSFDASVLKIAREQARNPIDARAERVSDLRLRGELFNGFTSNRTSHQSVKQFLDGWLRPWMELAVIHPPIPGGSGVLFCVSVIFAGWGFCTARPLIYKGQRYWVGSLNHRVDNRESQDRVDLAVFTREGAVRDQKLAEEIYAKYLLLSIL